MSVFSQPVHDVKVSRLILKHYFRELEEAVESDVIVIGAGPAGLICAHTLADEGYKVTVLDRRLAPGGGIAVVDLHSTEEKIAGVVINNSAIEAQGLPVDPMVLTAKAVLDSTGHDAVLVNLYGRRTKMEMTKEHFMNAPKGEEDVVKNTRMVAPGLFVAGMAANNVDGGCRMGPVFGGMLLSGKKAASLIAEYIRSM